MNNGWIQAHRHVIGKIVLFQFSTLQRELQSARNIYDKLNIPVKTAVHQFPLPPPLYPSTDLGVGVHFHPERINRVDCLWFVHDSALCVIYLRGTQLDETFFCRWRIDKSNIRGCFVFLAISQPKDDLHLSMACYFEYSISNRSSLLFEFMRALMSIWKFRKFN